MPTRTSALPGTSPVDNGAEEGGASAHSGIRPLCVFASLRETSPLPEFLRKLLSLPPAPEFRPDFA
jgi:hypothetical protein